MSCGVCPEDRFASGLSIRGRASLYSRSFSAGYAGLATGVKKYGLGQPKMYGGQTQYGTQGATMKKYVQHARYSFAPGYISNGLYGRKFYTSRANDIPDPLEKKVGSFSEKKGIELLLDQKPLTEREMDDTWEAIIYKAQSVVRSLADKKRTSTLAEINKLRIQSNENAGEEMERVA